MSYLEIIILLGNEKRQFQFYTNDKVDISQPVIATSQGLRFIKKIKNVVMYKGCHKIIVIKVKVVNKMLFHFPFDILLSLVTISLLKRNEVITLINRDNLCTECILWRRTKVTLESKSVLFLYDILLSNIYATLDLWIVFKIILFFMIWNLPILFDFLQFVSQFE